MENNEIKTSNVNLKAVASYFYKHLSVIAIVLSIVSIIFSSMALTNANKSRRIFHANRPNDIRFERQMDYRDDGFGNKFTNRPNNDFGNRPNNNFYNKTNNDFQNKPHFNQKPDMPLDRNNGPKTAPEISPDKPQPKQNDQQQSNQNDQHQPR